MKKIQLTMDTDYKTIFHSVPSLILVLKPDSEYTIVDASDAYLTATLTKRNEIINKALFQIFPENPDDEKDSSAISLRQSFEKVVKTKEPDIMPAIKYDIPLPTGGYEVRYWTPKNTPLLNSKQEVVYIINQVEDVTTTTLLQNEIKKKSLLLKENEDRINAILGTLLKYTVMDFSERLLTSDKGDELDAIVVGLNSLADELQEHMQMLLNSNKELEYSNKELDSFSYSVSHDLRAPLRAINGFSQVLMEDYGDKLSNDGKETIEIIIKNAQKMGALIDDLLTFSRVGKQNLTKVPLNIEKMVDAIIQEYTIQSSKNHVEFQIKHLENIEGDSSMLKQVFINLISNAVKYSSKKEKAIIDIGSFKKENDIVYYVKDNGVGFDMKYYGKLFGVFQRLHSSYEFEGTGVGLALVQRIIKKHHGDVWAEAKLEEGATFYFSLPI